MNDKNIEVLNEEAITEKEMIIEFSKPYTFEGVVYTKLDLTSFDEVVNGKTLKEAKRFMPDSGIDVMPEFSYDFAFFIASKVCALPIEFFDSLPAREAIKVKNRIMGFLFA